MRSRGAHTANMPGRRAPRITRLGEQAHPAKEASARWETCQTIRPAPGPAEAKAHGCNGEWTWPGGTGGARRAPSAPPDGGNRVTVTCPRGHGTPAGPQAGELAQAGAQDSCPLDGGTTAWAAPTRISTGPRTCAGCPGARCAALGPDPAMCGVSAWSRAAGGLCQKHEGSAGWPAGTSAAPGPADAAACR